MILESIQPNIDIEDDDGTIKIKATENGKIVGDLSATEMSDAYFMFEDMMSEEEYYQVFPDDFFLRIEHVEVDPSYRGRGYAKMLMNSVIDYAKNNMYNVLYLNASPMGVKGLDVNGLVKLYESLGFREIPNIQQYPDNKEMVMYLK